MFIDEAKIRVKAGGGGNGCMAFRRNELYLVETVANLLYIVQNTHVVQNV